MPPEEQEASLKEEKVGVHFETPSEVGGAVFYSRLDRAQKGRPEWNHKFHL